MKRYNMVSGYYYSTQESETGKFCKVSDVMTLEEDFDYIAGHNAKKREIIVELMKALKSVTSGIGTPDDYEIADNLINKHKGNYL